MPTFGIALYCLNTLPPFLCSHPMPLSMQDMFKIPSLGLPYHWGLDSRCSVWWNYRMDARVKCISPQTAWYIFWTFSFQVSSSLIAVSDTALHSAANRSWQALFLVSHFLFPSFNPLSDSVVCTAKNNKGPSTSPQPCCCPWSPWHNLWLMACCFFYDILFSPLSSTVP